MDSDKIVEKVAKTFRITAEDSDFTISTPKVVQKRGNGNKIRFIVRATIRFVGDVFDKHHEEFYLYADGTPNWDKVQFEADETWMGAITRCDRVLRKYKWSIDVWSFKGTSKKEIYTGFAVLDYEFGIEDALETLQDSYR